MGISFYFDVKSSFRKLAIISTSKNAGGRSFNSLPFDPTSLDVTFSPSHEGHELNHHLLDELDPKKPTQNPKPQQVFGRLGKPGVPFGSRFFLTKIPTRSPWRILEDILSTNASGRSKSLVDPGPSGGKMCGLCARMCRRSIPYHPCTWYICLHVPQINHI